MNFAHLLPGQSVGVRVRHGGGVPRGDGGLGLHSLQDPRVDLTRAVWRDSGRGVGPKGHSGLMRPHLLALAAELNRRGEVFALVTVVRREAPSSARLGDAALITSAGEFHGWLGGSCTRPTAVREALAAIRDGTSQGHRTQRRPRRATVAPTFSPILMACHSGGSVDLYIEPVLPAPCLVVFGSSPVAQAAVRIAAVLGYTTALMDPDDVASADTAWLGRCERSRLFALVATHGERDEASLREASPSGRRTSVWSPAGRDARRSARCCSPEASPGPARSGPKPRGARHRRRVARGDRAQRDRRDRAGDAELGAGTGRREPAILRRTSASSARVAVDPVCHMEVEIATAKHRAEIGGRDLVLLLRRLS